MFDTIRRSGRGASLAVAGAGLVLLLLAACEQITGPGPVAELPAASWLAAGGSHTCALTPGGRAYCWGAGWSGQTGHSTIQVCTTPTPSGVTGGKTSCTREPWPVETELRFSAITSGRNHSCALTADGRAYCWGANGAGELGDGTQTDSDRPVPAAGGHRFRQIAAGGSSTCAVDEGGGTYCWGRVVGALPGSTSVRDAVTPQRVPVETRFTSVSMGGESDTQACGISDRGAAYCWGSNSIGQLGTGGSPGQVMTPQPVIGDLLFSTISVGRSHICGITRTGALHCWGFNTNGQVGVERQIPARTLPPTRVLPELAFRSVSAGSEYTCAVSVGGELYCWGYGLAPLGFPRGSSPSSAPPTRVPAGAELDLVTAGESHACATTGGGEVHCWGSNAYGQLGDRTTTSSLTPTPVWGDLRVGRPR